MSKTWGMTSTTKQKTPGHALLSGNSDEFPVAAETVSRAGCSPQRMDGDTCFLLELEEPGKDVEMIRYLGLSPGRLSS